MSSNSDSLSPLAFAASYTADFIADQAKSESLKALLDVGCGDGLLTRNLQLRGHDVVAIDASEKGIERAKTNGIEAQHCALADFNHAPFDLIYMSRALHHMPPLEQTVEKISELLSEHGALVIEDFGFEKADETACLWLFEQAAKVFSEQSQPSSCEFKHEWLHDQLDSPVDAYARWQKRYSVEHQLWTEKQMLSALQSKFVLQDYKRVPYLFRFICDLLPDTADGAEAARQCLAEEQRLIDANRIAAVGFRVVATHK